MSTFDKLSSVPKRPLKRALEDLDSELAPALKRYRSVISWLHILPTSPPPTYLHYVESTPPLLESNKALPHLLPWELFTKLAAKDRQHQELSSHSQPRQGATVA